MTGIRPLLCLFVLLLSGCAGVANQRVDILYTPAGVARGGTGEVFLVERASPSGAHPVQFVIGRITSPSGEKLADVVSDIPPDDTVLHALRDELGAAGYAVSQVPALPPGVGKGVELKEVQVRLDEVRGAVSLDAACTIKVSFEVWRQGAPVRKLAYEANVADSTVADRAVLLPATLKKGLHLIMQRAIPDIVALLDPR